MNTPGNNLLGNNASVASILGSNSGLQTFGYGPVLMLAGVVLLAVGLLLLVNYYQMVESLGLSDRLTAFSNFLNVLPSSASLFGLTTYGALQSVSTVDTVKPLALPTESVKTRDQKEHWCFVGEDLTGRWCVKVPQPSSCEKDRLYTNRSECELVTTSKSPLGIIKNGGMDQTLLAALHTK